MYSKYFTRSLKVRVWKEVHKALKLLSGRDYEDLQFQMVDLASVIVLAGIWHPHLVEIVGEEFDLNSIERAAFAQRLMRIRKLLRKEGMYYAEKAEA